MFSILRIHFILVCRWHFFSFSPVELQYSAVFVLRDSDIILWWAHRRHIMVSSRWNFLTNQKEYSWRQVEFHFQLWNHTWQRTGKTKTRPCITLSWPLKSTPTLDSKECFSWTSKISNHDFSLIIDKRSPCRSFLIASYGENIDRQNSVQLTSDNEI